MASDIAKTLAVALLFSLLTNLYQWWTDRRDIREASDEIEALSNRAFEAERQAVMWKVAYDNLKGEVKS